MTFAFHGLPEVGGVRGLPEAACPEDALGAVCLACQVVQLVTLAAFRVKL